MEASHYPLVGRHMHSVFPRVICFRKKPDTLTGTWVRHVGGPSAFLLPSSAPVSISPF